MTNENKRKRKITSEKVRAVIARVLLLAVACAGIAYATTGETVSADNRKLLNGSFEEGPTFTKDYDQPNQSDVPSWNTTAFEGKIELLKKNTNTYIPGVTVTPSDGKIAAELNADEESTLYQIVNTTPSSVYEWGLDHGARNGTDIMALVIGPKQSFAPSKPNKSGRDQFMQMVDWLNIDNSTITPGAQPKQYTVYSKKFAASGAFEDNAGNNAFSLTPSTIYTEEWHIWIMSSSKATSGTNPWNSYGSNAEGSAGSSTGSGGTEVDLSKYYLYTVPAGQTETVFGFVSVGYLNSTVSGDKAKTYGNFLDGINFQLYHPLSGSTTTHGSAVVGGSDGSTSGEGGSEGHKITIGDKLATYVLDGEPLKIQAIVKKADAEAGCEFVGIYYTNQDKDGNPVTKFLQLAGNEIEDTGSLTDEQKKGKWIKSANEDGDIVYTYYLEGLTSATDLHFVFIKNPTVTYDPNGGKAYVIENRPYSDKEAENVYSFKPIVGGEGAEAATGTLFIPPYVSKAAEGQNDGWKFMGWLLTGDTVDKDNIPAGTELVNSDELGSLLLPAEHTIACDYSTDGAIEQTASQYFKIYDGNVSLTKIINQNANGEDSSVTWKDNSETKTYANIHNGLTMVAQWRWRQAFIPQVKKGDDLIESEESGTVEITSVTSTTKQYSEDYGSNGGKAYFAETDETVTAKAIAKDGYEFLGWYDASGNLITTNAEYSYVETKEGVNTFYARFSGKIKQTYIRQVKNGDAWEDTTNDAVGTLGRYEYEDAAGMPISSTATEGANYKFVGWYDSEGNAVADSMLTNNGTTISYTTTVDATYYARFETAYTVKFQAQTKKNGSFVKDTTGGKVSVASVKDVDGKTASSRATANSGYKFIGWYDKNGNQLSTNATYSITTTSATNNVTYYARFEIVYNPTVENKAYLSFIAESAGTTIPSVFDKRDAGTGKNTEDYGLDSKYGNTISTGFKYRLDKITDVSTVQITVTVPDSAYVKVGGTGSFTGNGTSILTDSGGVKYNKGSIQKISGATTLTYYWDALGLQANTTYGFIIDNLYAPGATATITVNGKSGTEVTNNNGVVNTAASDYRGKSHYPQ